MSFLWTYMYMRVMEPCHSRWCCQSHSDRHHLELILRRGNWKRLSNVNILNCYINSFPHVVYCYMSSCYHATYQLQVILQHSWNTKTDMTGLHIESTPWNVLERDNNKTKVHPLKHSLTHTYKSAHDYTRKKQNIRFTKWHCKNNLGMIHY